MLTERENYIWSTLVDLGIATNEEIGLVVAINGTNENVLNQILFVREGYRDLEQMFSEQEEEEEEEE